MLELRYLVDSMAMAIDGETDPLSLIRGCPFGQLLPAMLGFLGQ
jgi:hypothetical protein